MMSDMSSSETESGASSVAGPEGQVEEGPIASVVPAIRSPLDLYVKLHMELQPIIGYRCFPCRFCGYEIALFCPLPCI